MSRNCCRRLSWLDPAAQLPTSCSSRLDPCGCHRPSGRSRRRWRRAPRRRRVGRPGQIPAAVDCAARRQRPEGRHAHRKTGGAAKHSGSLCVRRHATPRAWPAPVGAVNASLCRTAGVVACQGLLRAGDRSELPRCGAPTSEPARRLPPGCRPAFPPNTTAAASLIPTPGLDQSTVAITASPSADRLRRPAEPTPITRL